MQLEADTFPFERTKILFVLFDRKREPQWMTGLAYRVFSCLAGNDRARMANVHYAKPDQAISYYSAPKAVDPNKTLDDVDPELLEMYKS
jgi:Fe-S cluster assembly protein SufB